MPEGVTGPAVFRSRWPVAHRPGTAAFLANRPLHRSDHHGGWGIQQTLTELGATTRVEAIGLTAEENTEYGGWKRLGMALGHFADAVVKNEREAWLTVGLLATCPSMPGLVAGLQPPETTRSGTLGGMPVAVATGRALRLMRLDAKLDPPLEDRYVVMAGVRLTDPLEQQMLDDSRIEQLLVEDLRQATPAVFAQLDRLSRLTDRISVHIDMDVLDPREVEGHGNKVPQRSIERAARLLVRADLPALSQGLGDRVRHHSEQR